MQILTHCILNTSVLSDWNQSVSALYDHNNASIVKLFEHIYIHQSHKLELFPEAVIQIKYELKSFYMKVLQVFRNCRNPIMTSYTYYIHRLTQSDPIQ